MRLSLLVAPISLLLFVAFPAANPHRLYSFEKTATQASVAPDPDNKVDINAASIDQLMKVPGMTRTWAARIVRFRPYRAKNDLLDRGVLPSRVYDRIKDYIIAHRVK